MAKKSKRSSSSVFTIQQSNAIITSSDNKTTLEPLIRSYKIRRGVRGSFVVDEVYRKGKKPQRRATIRPKKGKKLTQKEAIQKFKETHKTFRLKHQYTDKINPYMYTVQSYQNYAPTKAQKGVIVKRQLQILAKVTSRSTRVTGTYIGYSNSLRFPTSEDHEIDEATDDELEDQAVSMCMARFYADHRRFKRKTGDLRVEIITRRWIVRRRKHKNN